MISVKKLQEEIGKKTRYLITQPILLHLLSLLDKNMLKVISLYNVYCLAFEIFLQKKQFNRQNPSEIMRTFSSDMLPIDIFYQGVRNLSFSYQSPSLIYSDKVLQLQQLRYQTRDWQLYQSNIFFSKFSIPLSSCNNMVT